MTIEEEMNYERNQFVIRYNNMKGKYCTSPYSGYDYKTCGSILHYLYLYCGLRYAERLLISNGQVVYPDSIETKFASYTFDDDNNIPIFAFYSSHESNEAIQMFITNQFIFLKGLEEENLLGLVKESEEWKYHQLEK